MTKATILIIEDDPDIRGLLVDILRDEEVRILTASNEEQGMSGITENKVDLVLLDLVLGNDDGLEVLKKIRAMSFDMPIIIVSSKNRMHSKVLGLGLGADDYITKPFDESELVARINAHLRRYRNSKPAAQGKEESITVDALRLDLKSFKVYKNEKEVHLSLRCIKILRLFMENPNRVFSKEQIYHSAWDDTFYDDNTIMVYISELRKKIESDSDRHKYIQTIRGLGYKFVQ